MAAAPDHFEVAKPNVRLGFPLSNRTFFRHHPRDPLTVDVAQVEAMDGGKAGKRGLRRRILDLGSSYERAAQRVSCAGDNVLAFPRSLRERGRARPRPANLIMKIDMDVLRRVLTTIRSSVVAAEFSRAVRSRRPADAAAGDAIRQPVTRIVQESGLPRDTVEAACAVLNALRAIRIETHAINVRGRRVQAMYVTLAA